MEFDGSLLLQGRDWTWLLHANQCYLGRVVMMPTVPRTGSLAELDAAEWQSLRAHIRAYEAAMAEVFAPDRFNYMQLGNVDPVLHVHAVPRYATQRTWRGHTIVDPRWGQAPHPEPPSPFTAYDTDQLAAWLRAEIERHTMIVAL